MEPHGYPLLFSVFLFIFLATSPAASDLHNIPHQIHPLRPRSGAHGHEVPGLSCLSWRLGVETHNLIGWKTVPEQCEKYVGHYMLGRQYRDDSKAVVDEAWLYAQSLKLAGDGKEIWVFDVDETTLSNLPYYAKHGFGTKPYDPRMFSSWVMEQKAPALPESLKLYKKLLSLGLKVVFLTGRAEDQRNVTAANLNDVGFHTWEKLILKESYYSGKTAVAYKSSERKRLEENNGYRIIGNIGDQWSDIIGTNSGNRTFKLPDPLYYIS
ncbi:hypothetical protein ACOSP7_020338 [Xanthoceras sorbifolium]|uniref:Acid phosphatase n=1 Tax=Xanthoceras sorbifolium TaxID=99658 RepID=A0ABQ8HLY4_9ROSI|nr:hypothetical protein JRO89_XS09G0190000 [Xanthoceras sorbifolium]